MSREDLHLLTAYALGELQGTEKTRIENMVKADPLLQKTVKEIRDAASLFASDLGSRQPAGLSPMERAKVERGWKELADKESKPGFLGSLFGPLPTFAAAAVAFLIVGTLVYSLVPNINSTRTAKPTVTTTENEVMFNPPQVAAPAMKDAADEGSADVVAEAAPEADRKALFVKIEKKEVNAEIGSAGAKSADADGFGGGGIGGGAGEAATEVSGLAKGKAIARNAPAKKAAPAMSVKKQVRPLSVLFGGDGEVVTGLPNSSIVKERLRGQTVELMRCYSNALEAQSKTRGKMVLRWKIKSGRTTGAAVANSEFGNATFETCVLTTIKNVHFGPEANGASVVMPFHFSSPD